MSMRPCSNNIFILSFWSQLLFEAEEYILSVRDIDLEAGLFSSVAGVELGAVVLPATCETGTEAGVNVVGAVAAAISEASLVAGFEPRPCSSPDINECDLAYCDVTFMLCIAAICFRSRTLSVWHC